MMTYSCLKISTADVNFLRVQPVNLFAVFVAAALFVMTPKYLRLCILSFISS